LMNIFGVDPFIKILREVNKTHDETCASKK
jgi:hypothetical protein